MSARHRHRRADGWITLRGTGERGMPNDSHRLSAMRENARTMSLNNVKRHWPKQGQTPRIILTKASLRFENSQSLGRSHRCTPKTDLFCKLLYINNIYGWHTFHSGKNGPNACHYYLIARRKLSHRVAITVISQRDKALNASEKQSWGTKKGRKRKMEKKMI